MNTIERTSLIFEGTSYENDGDFSCGNNFASLAALVRWLITHHGGGPGGGGPGGPGPGPGDPFKSREVTQQLSQVAAGLMTFVGAQGVHDGALRSRVASEGLARSAKALAGLQQHAGAQN